MINTVPVGEERARWQLNVHSAQIVAPPTNNRIPSKPSRIR
jgi:hypothetical protein